MTASAASRSTIASRRSSGPLPKERLPDSTIALLLDPYRWIGRRAATHGSTAFGARVLGEETLVVTGPVQAARFYDGGTLTRQGAMPPHMLKVLQDQGSVTTLDGDRHRVRKALFLSLMTAPRLADAAALFASELDDAIERWSRAGDVVFDREIAEVITRSTCAWAGVPLTDALAPQLAADFQAMFDGAGAVGPRWVRAAIGRAQIERWGKRLAEAVQSGRVRPEPGTALHALASHEDERGRPLDPEILMTELVNVIRPTVAVGRYLTFAALSLQAHPARREQLSNAGLRPSVVLTEADGHGVDAPADPVWRFVQEVRRTAPFFPVMAGRTLRETDWDGHPLPKGHRVLLDLYGTNHDPSAWSLPSTFDPDRFAKWEGDPYRLIPQGAGDHRTDHRCPGEWLTIALMHAGVAALVHKVDYEVPPQDLSVSLRRIPARPASGLVLRRVRRR